MKKIEKGRIDWLITLAPFILIIISCLTWQLQCFLLKMRDYAKMFIVKKVIS